MKTCSGPCMHARQFWLNTCFDFPANNTYILRALLGHLLIQKLAVLSCNPPLRSVHRESCQLTGIMYARVSFMYLMAKLAAWLPVLRAWLAGAVAGAASSEHSQPASVCNMYEMYFS